MGLFSNNGTADITKLQGKLETCMERIDALADALRSARGKAAGLSKRVVRAEEKILRLEEKMRELSEELELGKKLYEEAESDIEDEEEEEDEEDTDDEDEQEAQHRGSL